MKYKYPKIGNTLTYRRINDDEFEVVDYLSDNSYTFGLDIVRYIKKLDGNTHPYRIPTCLNKSEIDQLLTFLDENELIRKSDIRVGFGTVLKTIWIPRWTKFLRLLAYFVNLFLLVLWLPVLIIGAVMLSHSFFYLEFDWYILGYVIGIAFGGVLHELGHAFAGIAYGAHVFEMGVLIMHFVMPGAYVIIDSKNVVERMKRIQINAAGVEMNFLLTGIFMICAAMFTKLGGLFIVAAISNLFIGALNLTLIKGLDGTAIISELLATENLHDKAKAVVFDKKTRHLVLERGVLGYAVFFICCVLCLMQLMLPLLTVFSVLEVISCFA